MCTLAVYFRVFEASPLVVAANRDEFYDRPTASPALLERDPVIFGGRDLTHGGTWLGVSAFGVTAALLNRRSAASPDPSRRSRGLLCVDALRHRSARDGARALKSARPDTYNPFNLLIADASESWVVTNDGRTMRTKELAPGLHLITNLDVDDPECPRISASTSKFSAIGSEYHARSVIEAVPSFRDVLADHGTPLDPRDTGPGSGLCVHLGSFGTRSSTILILDSAGRWTYLHASGAPCANPLRPVRLPAEIGST